jgi:hypothetical protein
MPILRVISGSNTGTVYELARENLLIGRDLDVQIQVPDQGVSRRHAEIMRVGDLFLLRDCGSRNGTFINEDRVTERVLRQGDKITVGNTVFAFEDRPELLEQSKLIQFHDGALNPHQTLFLRTTSRGAAAEPHAGANAFRDSPLLVAMERIAHIVSGEETLGAVLSKSLAELGAAIRALQLTIFTLTRAEGADQFRLIASWSTEPGKPQRVSRSVMEQTCRDGQPILVHDAGQDARFSTEDSIVSQGLRSIMCAPLKAQQQPFGVLYAAECGAPAGFGAEDLELFTAVATQLGLAIAAAKTQHRHDVFFKQAMRVLVAAIEHRLPETKGAGERIANFCAATARALRLDPQDVRYAWLSGLLHNAATLGLSDRELAEHVLLPIRRSRAAEELFSHLPGMGPVLAAIKDQDECYDGTGTPEGKKGDNIPLLAQVLGVAKHFDRLLSGDLSGNAGVPIREALLAVNELKDRQFPARVVNALFVAYRRGELFLEEQQFNAVDV